MEWLTGTGQRNHEFREGDPFTELLQTHSHIEETRAMVAVRVEAGNYEPGHNDYSVAGLEGVPKYFQDYSNVLTFGNTGNLAVTFLGSYSLDYYVESANCDSGNAEVLFNVRNESTLASATHPPILGYTEFWQSIIEPMVNGLTPSGPMSRVTQDFWWTETIPIECK